MGKRLIDEGRSAEEQSMRFFHGPDYDSKKLGYRKSPVVLKMCQMITDRMGHRVNYDDPDYYGVITYCTDEMARVALAMGVRKDRSFDWIQKKTNKDPKDTFEFSVNGYRILYEACKYDNDPKNIALMNKDMPLLVVSGADDPVGDAGAGTTEAFNKYKEAGIRDVTLKLFPGDRHEILQETDRADVFAFLFDWMTQRM